MASASSTIFALSSGRGPSAIAVVRISGPRAGAALEALGVKIPPPRKAGLARVREPASGEIIDEALVLWFPAPNSETGEDTAELQLHGGRAVIAATLAALGRVEGLRPAEAGEFTRRAFENGKLDLTAVEGLADLVSAETEGQRRQAFRQMKGLLGGRAEAWRQQLIQALALVEARIDFSDEGDVPENLVEPAVAIARSLADEIAGALADGGRGERLREGLVVAIAGPPNAGKSTLLNRLARREAAIVSPYAGTTRDVIEVHLDLGGLPVTLLDTAGIRETDDPVEMEGVRRARDRAASADLVLWVVDAADEISGRREMSTAESISLAGAGTDSPTGLAAESESGFATSRQVGALTPIPRLGRASEPGADPDQARERGDRGHSGPGSGAGVGQGAPVSALNNPLPPVWIVLNKIDLLPGEQRNETRMQNNAFSGGSHAVAESKFRFNKILKNIVNKNLPNMVNDPLTSATGGQFARDEAQFILSATSGEGFEALLHSLSQFAESFMTGAESALVTRARHRRALEDTQHALRRALQLGSREDLLAEELRTAATALGRLTGRVDVEDILDVIFRDFCIGK